MSEVSTRRRTSKTCLRRSSGLHRRRPKTQLLLASLKSVSDHQGRRAARHGSGTLCALGMGSRGGRVTKHGQPAYSFTTEGRHAALGPTEPSPKGRAPNCTRPRRLRRPGKARTRLIRMPSPNPWRKTEAERAIPNLNIWTVKTGNGTRRQRSMEQKNAFRRDLFYNGGYVPFRLNGRDVTRRLCP